MKESSCTQHASRSLAVTMPVTQPPFTIGETDFECWGRLWKAYPGDPEIEGEEWVTFLESIQEHFRSNYENFPDEFYFWGDFSGDRTLDLKIAKPTVLTNRLLSDLQKYLQMNGQKMWRVRIPIYFKPNDPHRVVVVYPHTIDIPPLLPSSNVRECGCCCDVPRRERRRGELNPQSTVLTIYRQ
jgi:hypothetical protein